MEKVYNEYIEVYDRIIEKIYIDLHQRWIFLIGLNNRNKFTNKIF